MRKATLLLCFFIPVITHPLHAQEAGASTPPLLKVFIDCKRCDHSYLKGEVDFVEYVRDRKVADVHVLVTSINSGGGGRNMKFNFIDLRELVGPPNAIALKVNTFQNDTRIEVNEKVARVMRVGLLPYVVGTAPELRVNVRAPHNQLSTSQPAGDRWNYWVFEVGGDLDIEKESNQFEYQLEGQVDIERTTHAWRIRNALRVDYRFNRVDRDDGAISSSLRRSALESSIVKSLSEHLSIGVFGRVQSSTFNNIELSYRTQAAIEYNYFPYRMAASKEFTFAYLIGPRYFNYWETTIYGQEKEGLIGHAIRIFLDIQKEWGSVNAGFEVQQYLHDLSKSRLDIAGNVSLRVVKGLFLRMGARFKVIHDQLYLPRGEATVEEILLERRALATNFELDFNFGVRYTFGSIYNSILNTRL